MWAKHKCYNCGIIDKSDAKGIDGSRLIWDIGMPDLNGLQTHLIYCRSCGTVNIYKPGWLGNIKFDQFLKYEILLEKLRNGTLDGPLKSDPFQIITPRIRRAMIEDGILPGAYFQILESYAVLRSRVETIFAWGGSTLGDVTELAKLDKLVTQWTMMIFADDTRADAEKVTVSLKRLISLYSNEASNIDPVMHFNFRENTEENQKAYAASMERQIGAARHGLQESLQKHQTWAGHVRGRLNNEW
jgi:hypothetical protein